jgi:putative addiction module component (TIGR02574 family)
VPREALQLTPKARAAVAGHLVCSLGARDEHDLDEAWVTEVKRRITDVDARRVKVVSWQRAQRCLRAELRGARTKR